MKPGDTLRLIDGKNLVQIGETLKIPDNARTAVLQLKSGTGMVKSFLKFLEKDSSLSPKQSAITPGSNLNIPKICSDEVPEANANILLIGSPLYHDDVEAHDMRYGWLGDGYFSDAEWPLDLVGAFGSQLRGRVDPSGPHFPA